MRLLRASKLCEVKESKYKDEVNNKEQNIEWSVNIPSFRKPVLSEQISGRFFCKRLRERNWGKLYT
jgi:hypothetical protein